VLLNATPMPAPLHVTSGKVDIVVKLKNLDISQPEKKVSFRVPESVAQKGCNTLQVRQAIKKLNETNLFNEQHCKI